MAPLREEDAEILFRWINERELVLLSSRFDPPTEEEHRSWFSSIRARDDVEIWGIRLVEDDRLIGSCQLHSIDRHHRNAELQVRIGERVAWGRGYGTEAVRLLVSHAFDDLDLHRVSLHVFTHNERAIRAYERAGFQREGRLREAAFIDGRYLDVFVMAALRS